MFANADDRKVSGCDESSVGYVCEIDLVAVASKYKILSQNDPEGVNNRLINLTLISILSRASGLTSRSPATYLASNVKRTKKLRLGLP